MTQAHDSIAVWFARAESQIRVGSLSQNELQRLDRIACITAARTFCTARRMLRFLLARQLSCSPGEVELCYGHRGKPCVRQSRSTDGVEFNVSHAGEFIAVAISGAGPVGVDLEQARPLPDTEQLAARILSEAEMHAWCSLEQQRRCRWLYWFWTRKEAVLKLEGSGLAGDVRGLDVLPSLRPGGGLLSSVMLGDLIIAVASRRSCSLWLHEFTTDVLGS